VSGRPHPAPAGGGDDAERAAVAARQQPEVAVVPECDQRRAHGRIDEALRGRGGAKGGFDRVEQQRADPNLAAGRAVDGGQLRVVAETAARGVERVQLGVGRSSAGSSASSRSTTISFRTPIAWKVPANVVTTPPRSRPGSGTSATATRWTGSA
jgi:hypothetical protein